MPINSLAFKGMVSAGYLINKERVWFNLSVPASDKESGWLCNNDNFLLPFELFIIEEEDKDNNG